MIFRQLFDRDTYTYTYLLGDESTREAVLIDPVIEQVDYYLQLLDELELNLTSALDTHVHADHVTALGLLRDKTNATTYLSNAGEVDCADKSLHDGQLIKIGKVEIQVLYTPGHTDDSYSFYVDDNKARYLFSGDTLLIRGTGRTDFQNGNAEDLYDSLHQKLLALPEDTYVYPAHDYKGWTVSSIAEEKANNPRVNINSKVEFVRFMNTLNLPDPKYMDIAVPANRSCGKTRGV